MKGLKPIKHTQPYPGIPIILALVLAGMPAWSALAARVRYAKPAVSGTGDCSSWANACTLQSSVSGAVDGDEIWVMGGVYKPGRVSDLRTATFQLKSGVALYGGLPPSGDPEFGARETARVSKIISFTRRGEHETLGEF